MAKLIIHDDRECIAALEAELPDDVSWGAYLVECIRLRKRLEAREVVLAAPGTLTGGAEGSGRGVRLDSERADD